MLSLQIMNKFFFFFLPCRSILGLFLITVITVIIVNESEVQTRTDEVPVIRVVMAGYPDAGSAFFNLL